MGSVTGPGRVLRSAQRLPLGAITPASTRPSTRSRGSVVLRTPSALPLDDYAQLRRTGAFLLIDEQSGNTLAAGLVGEG